MKQSLKIRGLWVVISLQLLILCGMVVKAAMPLWTGMEIRVKTIPVDPRSMFRGNYARLSYEIGQLPNYVLNDAGTLRNNEIVYVNLILGEDGLYNIANVSLDKPSEGVFLRGRIADNTPPYQVKYGIEAFFAPKEKALRLEQELSNGGVAILMVTETGSVALKDVVLNSPKN